MSLEANASEIYDSLPYYDNDLEEFPNLKEIVEKEFAKAPKAPSNLHPKVPPEINLFAVSLSTYCNWLNLTNFIE